MKISNKKSIKATMYLLAVLLLLDVSLLLLIQKPLEINHTISTILSIIIFLLIVWRFWILKIAVLETSKYLFSLKYQHLFLQSNPTPPVLEVPLDKLEYCKIERNFLDAFLVIAINSNRGKRIFYYPLGFLSVKQIEHYRKLLNHIK